MVLVDQRPVVLEGLKAMLAPFVDRVEVVGEVLALEDVHSEVTGLGAEVVVLDLEAREPNGLAVAAQLMARQPPFRLVVFAGQWNDRLLFTALRLGAAGFVRRPRCGAELAGQLVEVCQGRTLVDPAFTGCAVLAAMSPNGNGATHFWPGVEFGLSPRESDVLELLVQGRSNLAISRELLVSEETVKTHLRAVYRKLEVHGRTQAVAKALRSVCLS